MVEPTEYWLWHSHSFGMPVQTTKSEKRHQSCWENIRILVMTQKLQHKQFGNGVIVRSWSSVLQISKKIQHIFEKNAANKRPLNRCRLLLKPLSCNSLSPIQKPMLRNEKDSTEARSLETLICSLLKSLFCGYSLSICNTFHAGFVD